MGKPQTLALAMIVKGTDDEAPLLAKCLESVARHVDAIYINLNHEPGKPVSSKVKKLCEQYTDKIYVTEWKNSFVDARNFIFDKVPSKFDWLLWLDSDDVVDMPHKMRDVISIAGKNIGGIFAKYDYAHDDLGNVTYTHWIIRLCRNNGAYKWKSSFDDGGESVHETLQDIRTSTNVRTEDFKIVHGSNPERGKRSLERNIKLLESMHKRQNAKGKVDPRILYYLATHYFEAAHDRDVTYLTKSEDLLTQYLSVSGWAEERSEAWVYLGLIFRMQQRNDAARQAFGKSILENPVNPKPYVELGELEFLEKRYPMSEEWLLTAISKRLPTTTSVLMPMENTFRAYLLLAQTYVNMGFSHIEEAAEYVDKALQLRPTDVDAKAAQELIENLVEERDNSKAFLRMSRQIPEDKMMQFIGSLPDDMQDNPAVINVRQKYAKPTKYHDKSVTIFCGNSAQGIWGPEDIDKTGMGGSEEAVIKMSWELAMLGYEVSIYATPGEQAGHHQEVGAPAGVSWKQYWEFNPKDEFNILIAWRMPWFFDVDIKAKKSYLWLHDVMDKEEFTDERIAKLDGCIFVSQYHADLYRNTIPDNKRFVSGNGITPGDFSKYDGKITRVPNKLIYTSSQLRGLEILLDIWPEVKEAVPEATLDTYYGWETFDEGNRNNPERMAWKDKMVKKMQALEGVIDHGRIGQDDLNKELFKASIFAYPCWFPEVYCISLIKAQAAGCYPVTSDFAVLKDFNLDGIQVHYDSSKIDKFKEDYKEALIDALRHPPITQVGTDVIRTNFSWEKTAKGWQDEFNK